MVTVISLQVRLECEVNESIRTNRKKALFKYIPRNKMNPLDIVGRIEDNEEYFLITNTKEIYNTTNETKVFAIMRNNEFKV
jgi:hypothetical protein